MEEHYEGSTPRCRGFRTFVGFLACITMALPSTLLGASFVLVERHFSSSLPWMTSMLSFHIAALLVARHLCSMLFHRLNFELQLGLGGLLGGGALMLSMYGDNFIAFTVAMAVQGLCTGYLQMGLEMYINLLWSNHKTRKILTYVSTVLWSVGSILGPVLIYVLFNGVPQGEANLGTGISGTGVTGTTINGFLLTPNPAPEVGVPEVTPPEVAPPEVAAPEVSNDTNAVHNDTEFGVDVPSANSHDEKESGPEMSPAERLFEKMRHIKYTYGVFGVVEMSAGGAFTVLYILLGPSFLRKDSVCMLSTKTNANLIGQPRCFGFGFIVLMVLFCFCFMTTEYFPRFLLSALVVHNENMSAACGAIMISAFETGIVSGRFLSLISSCLISARIMLNIALFLLSCSFLLLLTALTLNDIVLYSAAFAIGISVSNVYAHLFQWACNYLVISSFVRWATILGGILGSVIMLPIVGFLVQVIGYAVIAYVLLGASLGATVFLMVLQVYAAAARPVMQLADPTDEELRTFARAST